MRRQTLAVAALLLRASGAHARITHIVIDETLSPAFCKGTACTSYGEAGQYEQIPGRAFGELGPNESRNKLIQDIELDHESMDGVVTGERVIPDAEWNWWRGGTYQNPLPIVLPTPFVQSVGTNVPESKDERPARPLQI
jgi:hypothetical protein